MKNNPLLKIVKEQKAGKAKGMYSICSANKFVIEAGLLQAKKDNSIVCIEATSNQVDQFGGYTGMTPEKFVSYVKDITIKMEFPFERVILGGDHLGPNSWRNENAESAMEKSKELVAAYSASGFSKIHLDASMKCADDKGAVPSPKVIADRVAYMCEACEKSWIRKDIFPAYIVGTEVPTPGGATLEHSGVHITKEEDVLETINEMHEAFKLKGLNEAWERVHAVVVQPGVEFGDSSVDIYDQKKAVKLSSFIEKEANLVFEAHSTDYQTGESLKQMVKDHFAILKVGPWLTFALREALFSLEYIEKESLNGKKGVVLSDLQNILEKVMLGNPVHWKRYYQGGDHETAFKRKYSLSDRCRYYWPVKEVSDSLNKLIENLSKNEIPLTALSQFMPVQYAAIINKEIKLSPVDLIRHKVMEVSSIYSRACDL